jgi:DnaJ-class molecular chaperone
MQDHDEAERGDAAQDCMPCGGRGKLISKLGGQESTVQCPWCEGSGKKRKGIDAQAHWGAGAAAAGEVEGADSPGADGSSAPAVDA